MKKFFQTLDYGRIIIYAMLFLFIIGLINSLFENNNNVAADHFIMIVLTITLLIKDNSVISHKKVIDLQQSLISFYESRNDHQREIVKMLRNTIELKNERIAEILKSETDEQK